MYGLLLHKTFLFSKVKIISELGNADCGLLSLATSVGLTRLQLTPRNSERDVFLSLLLKNGRHINMMIGHK